MTPGRPGTLTIGDRVRFGGSAQTVVGLAGAVVHLADERGRTAAVALPLLLSAEGFEVIGARSGPVLGEVGSFDRLPERARRDALWWERHLWEVIHGVPPDAPVGVAGRPEYDPLRWSLTRREEAKAAELTRLGFAVKPSTIKHRRHRYEARGLMGLADGRADRQTPRFGLVDGRVVEAMRAAITEAADASSRTAKFVFWRTEQLLAEAHGEHAVAMPSRSTCYRLFATLSAGRHTTGSARTRGSLANRPEGPFSRVPVAAPGELMQIDSTPLDVLVRLDDGVVGRVELTAMIDVATRTVTAAVLRPTTKSIDAAVLLARTVTPEPMRPGWPDALRMSRSVLPHRRLLALDARMEHAAARPVILPETIVCDHGKVFLSHNFRASCRFLGINFQPAHEGTPTDKPHIERMLGSVGTLFAQFVAGYTGSSVERRGRHVEDEPLWSMLELQELLDEWLVSGWQNRPHDGLRDPLHPGRTFTPNEKYAAMVEAAGYVPVALSARDYIELLPACWRAINAYGIKINHRTYDNAQLNRLRHQPSGVKHKRDLWEVHHDPYDVSRVWVRNHIDGGWITVFWTHLDKVGVPFGELAWDHARNQVRDSDRRQTEQEIAAAVGALLNRASQGPPALPGRAPSKRSRRVAARTAATSESRIHQPRAVLSALSAGLDSIGDADTDTDTDTDTATTDTLPEVSPGAGAHGAEPMAAVIPLGIFDPYEEAKRRW